MGILNYVAVGGVCVAAGVGIGYLLFDKELECPEVKEANLANCMEVYDEGVEKFVETYANPESQGDLVTPNDINIDLVGVDNDGDSMLAYVVSNKKGDNLGVITQNRWNENLDIQNTSNLDELLSSAYDATPFKPDLTVYTIAENNEPAQ